MMVQCTCLLLLLLSTAVFSQNYDAFIVKHTLVKANDKKDCDTLMKACKAINTFIDERDEKIIQDMCKDVSKKQFVNLAYNCFDCVTKDKKEPCSYKQEKPNNNKKIVCEKDKSKNKFLPVHLEAECRPYI
uniref:Ribonuclease A-domain domain-containing protein n=1 Tax=Neolamprologus brichardi TaxID=32507 RepID=A0A3Q4HAP6_NEOBR